LAFGDLLRDAAECEKKKCYRQARYQRTGAAELHGSISHSTADIARLNIRDSGDGVVGIGVIANGLMPATTAPAPRSLPRALEQGRRPSAERVFVINHL
jgi:hypothetical protein